ncbi:MAG TPA: DNA methyltransferase [Streptomyces sp.]
MIEPLPAFLAAAVPTALREVSTWDADRRIKEADACADVIAGGADALFAATVKRGDVSGDQAREALARGLAILACRAEGVSFAGVTWTAEGCTGAWSLPDGVLTRQARGAYFTPRSLAEEITSRALGPLVDRDPDASDITAFRVADIACGAGAFLLAATRFLAAALLDAWDHDTRDEMIDVYGDLETAARAEVIFGCVHGVDIDPLSVELARVALQLLAPDEGSLALERNIRVGDALVGEITPGDTEVFPPGVERFDWHREFPHVFPERYDRREGFDAIIGNPPYLGGQKLTGTFGTPYREYLINHIAEGRKGSADLCAYFLIRACDLCDTMGTVGVITTNTLVQGATGRVAGLARDRGWGAYARWEQPWPTRSAAVQCVLVWLRRSRWIDPAWREDGRGSTKANTEVTR